MMKVAGRSQLPAQSCGSGRHSQPERALRILTEEEAQRELISEAAQCSLAPRKWLPKLSSNQRPGG